MQQPSTQGQAPQGGQGQQQKQPTKVTSGASNLQNSAINLLAVREHAKKELVTVLDSVPGLKALVLDPTLLGPLGLVAEVTLLKEHGVANIYSLTSGNFVTENKNVIYIVGPRVEYMRTIAQHIHLHNRDHQKKSYSLFFVPRRTMICERILEEEGVYNDIFIGEYKLDLIPIDDNLLSLEYPFAFKECFLEGDRTSLFYVARSLMKLQTLFGLIPTIRGKGSCSKSVVEMMLRMRKEMGEEEIGSNSEIDQIILIDRDVDVVTPLSTQLTYEGLVDENFGINNTYLDLDPAILGQKGAAKKVKIVLNGNDKFFGEIRDLNFSVLGPLLHRKAKEVAETFNQRHMHEKMSVSQMREFVKKFAIASQEHQSLRTHTAIAEKILEFTAASGFRKRLNAEQNLLAGTGVDASSEYIEEAIDRQDSLFSILRLLCLQSATSSIKASKLEKIRKEILQSYGYEHLMTLTNLEKMGMIKKDAKTNFPVLRKNLQLFTEDFDEKNPNDIAYVYSGYAPLSIRIVQQAFKPGGWRSELMNLMPGPTVEEFQGQPKVGGGGVTLVFFIGGVTFTEIAALKWLAKQGQQNGEENIYGDFIVGTTKLINGNSLLSSLLPDLSSTVPSSN